ncbi:hypothetical protein ACX80X_09465 [Pseudarthrobacter sp. MDT3-1]
MTGALDMTGFGMRMAGAFLVLIGLFAAGIAPVAAAPPSQSKDLVGIDISWPQCDKMNTLPLGQAFAIVGVNGGLANNNNPCFAAQIEWAKTKTTGTGNHPAQPQVSLYVNTANPGHEGSWWPSSNVYKDVAVPPDRYGECVPEFEGATRGPVDLACSYVYGYVRAYEDATIRGVTDPGSYFWWLDVETGNSWQTGEPNSTALNRATLEGMVDYFTTITTNRKTADLKPAGVGIYSTSNQWGTIAGTVPSSSPLTGLPSWLAGARTLRGAKSNCSLPGLTPGSTVTLTQYVSAGLDYDYVCPSK